MPNREFFHEASESVRFWVDVNDVSVGASVSRHTLHYRYDPQTLHDDPLVTFAAHRAALESAVRRRVGRGSIEPVLLRESDLAPGQDTTREP